MIYNLENNPTMVVTSSTHENLPRKFDLLCGHCKYKRVLWPIGEDMWHIIKAMFSYIIPLDSYVRAEVSGSAYGLYQMRCYEKAYQIMNQYGAPLVLCQGFRIHHCNSCWVKRLRSPFSQYEQAR